MTLCKLYYYGQNSRKYIYYPNKILSKSNFVPEKRNVRLEGWLLAGILFLFDPNDVTASCEGKFVLYFLVAKSTLELAGYEVGLHRSQLKDILTFFSYSTCHPHPHFFQMGRDWRICPVLPLHNDIRNIQDCVPSFSSVVLKNSRVLVGLRTSCSSLYI